MPKKHVFISYCRDNENEVAKLRDDLIAAGEPVWWDKDILGGRDWDLEIRKAMRDSYAVVLCLSKESEDRATCGIFPEARDAIAAYRKCKPGSVFLIPVRMSDCEIPLFKIDDVQMLDDLQYIDLFPSSKYTEGLKRLVESLQKAPERPSSMPPARIPSTITDKDIAVHDWFSPQWPVMDPAVFGRDEELAMLDDVWKAGKKNIVVLVAAGGVGKTALVNRWKNYHMQPANWRGAERIFGWSFYSQGAGEERQASADQFIDKALRWFGDPDLANTTAAAYDKGHRLAELVRQRKTLLLLDGAEPLQEPHGSQTAHEGKVKDPGLAGLLRGLANHNNGLCVVSTRIAIEDLKPYTAEGGSVVSEDLDNLTPEAGGKYLHSLGVGGWHAGLCVVSAEYGNHALSLTLLGRLIAKRYGGDIRRRDEISAITRGKKGRHARHVMAFYEKCFEGTPELDILNLLGLFDRPVEAGALDALRAEPPIEGLTQRICGLDDEDWAEALETLRDARLLSAPDAQATLDCHPLVREHFGEELRSKNEPAWKAGHKRLYEYYKALPEKDLPDTDEEMAPLFQAVIHGCRAGHHQEVYDEVYKRRIRRGDEFYNTRKLGAFGAELSALAGFFDPPWRRPVDALSEAAQALVLAMAAYCLRALGRLAEAVDPMRAGLKACIALKELGNAARQAGSLSEVLLALGKVADAVDYAGRGVRYTDDSGGALLRMAARTYLADALHQAGRVLDAKEHFIEAETLQRERQPEYPLLYSVQGFQFCDIFLEQGNYEEARRRGREFLKWRVLSDSLIDIAMEHLTLACAAMQAALLDGGGTIPAAEPGDATPFDTAVKDLRKAAYQDYLTCGLLARAEWYRRVCDFAHARRDLEEAWEIAFRCGMRLWLCAIHIETCRLLLALIEGGEGFETRDLALDNVLRLADFPDTVSEPVAAARAHLERAGEMVNEMGYHRRDAEILLESAHLCIHEDNHEQARKHLDAATAKIKEQGQHRWDHDIKTLEAQLQ